MTRRIRPVFFALAAALILGAAAPASANTPLEFQLPAELPRIETSFQTWDVCQQVDDWIDKLGAAGSVVPRLCGQEMTQSFGVAAAAVTLAGRLDQLVVRDGYASVDGSVDVSISLTSPELEGGRMPAFAPCDRGTHGGCFQPPSGDAFAEFLAEFAPAVSPNVPAPPRVCMPGALIKTRDGYYQRGRWIPGRWVGSGWNKRWRPGRRVRGDFVPPRFETCRVSDYGELPTLVAPEIEEIVIDAYPRVVADMGITAAGDGHIEIEIPIPYAGAKAGYGNSWIDLDLMAGLSLLLSLDVQDAGADAYLSFVQDLHIRSRYTRAEGWTQTATVLDSTMAPDLVPHSAEVSVRAAVKLGLEATAMASIGGESSDAESKPDATETDASDSEEPADTTESDETTGTETTETSTDETAESEEESGDVELPPLPVEESAQCAAEWLLSGAGLELGLESKADVVLFVEGSYPLFGDEDPAFDIDAGAEFSHAEALSLPGLCEIGCETVAGDGSLACAPLELLRVDIAEL